LKVQNICITPLLKHLNTHNKPWCEAVNLCENVINFHKQKVAKNVAISLGYLIFSKNHNELLNEAQQAKITLSQEPSQGAGNKEAFHSAGL
jgi:hypothetical protein